MFQAALLETMKTALAPCRTAVSISMALMPKAPSPLTEITCRSGKRERRRDRERHADAEAAEGAGVHVGARREPDAGEAQQIAAVGDGDVVGIGDRRRWRRRSTRGWILPSSPSARLGCCAAPRCHPLAMASAQSVGPGLVEARLRGCPRPPPWRRAPAPAWPAVPARRAGCRSARRRCRRCG